MARSKRQKDQQSIRYGPIQPTSATGNLTIKSSIGVHPSFTALSTRLPPIMANHRVVFCVMVPTKKTIVRSNSQAGSRGAQQKLERGGKILVVLCNLLSCLHLVIIILHLPVRCNMKSSFLSACSHCAHAHPHHPCSFTFSWQWWDHSSISLFHQYFR